MKTLIGRGLCGCVMACMPLALCACPPEGQNLTLNGPTGGPNVVDTKSYWPVATGNSWLLEDKNWRHATWVLEDYWVGSTEVCKMRNELTNEWGTQATEYHILWRDDYVVLVEKESANNVDFIAGLDFVPLQFPGVSILFRRFVDANGIDKSHEEEDNIIYHQTTEIDAVNQLLCGNAAKPISPDVYPLPPTTEVFLLRESNTAYCPAGSEFPITRIFAKGIGPMSRHNLRLYIAIIFDENANGTEGNYTAYEFNDNGYVP